MSTLGPSLRRRRRTSRAWPRLTAALAVSLLVNAGLLALVRLGVVHAPAPVRRAVEVAPLSSRAWEANRQVQVRDAPPADPAKRAAEILAELERATPPPPPVAPGQVVDVAPSKDSTPPKDSRFVSDRDNTVEKETISRDRRPGFPATAPVPTTPKPERKAEQQASADRAKAAQEAQAAREARAARGTAESDDRAAAERRAQKPGDRLALQLDRFGERMPPSPSERAAGAGPRGDPLAPEDGAPGASQRGQAGAVERSKLAPSAETYDRIAGGPAPDHVTGVEEGEGTYLNTREWKYASYFNRIKQAVANTWDPSRALAQRDPDGRRFAYRDRHTLVSVRLDQQGSLMDVEVVKSSGVDFLDQIALDAFRKAQPFVNPPRGLADPRGEIDFTFGFYLETGGGFRMYRAPPR